MFSSFDFMSISTLSTKELLKLLMIILSLSLTWSIVLILWLSSTFILVSNCYCLFFSIVISIESCESDPDRPNYENCRSGVLLFLSKYSLPLTLWFALCLYLLLLPLVSNSFILSIKELLMGINELFTLGICVIVILLDGDFCPSLTV